MISVKVSPVDAVSVSPIDTSQVGIKSQAPVSLPPKYEGAYEFTPSTSTQVAHTAGRTVGEDIIINPIPSNYGLISWSGPGIRVS